jgi:hypothetical protein
MLSNKLKILFLLAVVLFISTKSNDDEEDYDYGDNTLLDDCIYEIDFKTYTKTKKLSLCHALSNVSSKSRIQLQVYANHTEQKLRIRGIASTLTNPNIKKSLISLTTDVIEDFKYPTSLLTIDDYQLLSLSLLESISSSLINADLNLLGKNLKKTLIVAKGGHKQLLACSGNFYPKQDIKALNITPLFTKPITCTKEPPKDRFFALQERIYLDQTNQKNFHLVDIHQDDQKKISRSSQYTCNNPASCTTGVQNKKMLDKTVNYVIKFLQKARAEKKAASG